MVVVDDRQLNRATLARQHLDARAELGVVEVARDIVAMQAQHAASPYVALWNRVRDFDPADLDRAFAERRLVKATLMRITLHAVDVDDHRAFQQAMRPALRASRVNDKRYRDTGLAAADADDLVEPLIGRLSEPCGKDEIEDWLAGRLGADPEPRLFWALRTYAPLIHSPGDDPWSFGLSPRYEAAPDQRPIDRMDALRHLVRRYLAGFGPATVHDISQFTLLTKALVREVVDSLRSELTSMETTTGDELLDVVDGRIPDAATHVPPRLLAMWDSPLLAYTDRARIIPDEYRRHVIRRNGDVLPSVLVDGYVAGVWRPLDGRIEVTAFDSLADEVWGALEVEAADLAALIGARDHRTYSRYGNWWSKLPEGTSCLLG